MSLPTFTPGPWTVNEATLVIEQKQLRCDVAEVYRDPIPNAHNEAVALADARLIAAAPKLYAAAKEALEWHQAALRGATSGSNAFDVAESLQAALLLAEGR